MRALFIAIAALILLNGCQILKPAVDTTTVEKTEIEYRDTTIYLPGETVQEQVDFTKLEELMSNIKPGSTERIIYKSAGGNAELSFYKNTLGQIVASCESKDKQIELLVKEITKSKSTTSVETKIKKETPKWVWMLVGGLSFLVLTLVVILNLNKKK